MFTLKAGIARACLKRQTSINPVKDICSPPAATVVQTRSLKAAATCWVTLTSTRRSVSTKRSVSNLTLMVTLPESPGFATITKTKSSPEQRYWAIPPAAIIIFCNGRTGGKAVVEGLEGNLLIPVLRDVLSWRTNATGCSNLKVKRLATRCQVIPKYTVNTMLDWQVNDAPVCECELDALWPSGSRVSMRRSATKPGPLPPPRLAPIPSWVLVLSIQLNRDIRLNVGISNLFDKQLYRENVGASTYNEPGRAYYAGVTLSF